MPGLEKRLSRYPQLYSRVGFAHHYRPLQGHELAFVLTRHWRRLGLALDEADFTDAQAIASIARITGGNFRLLHRLFVQIGRILKINELSVITDDVVEAARSTLVIENAQAVLRPSNPPLAANVSTIVRWRAQPDDGEHSGR